MKKILYLVAAAFVMALCVAPSYAGTKIQTQSVNWVFNANSATNGTRFVVKKPIVVSAPDTTDWVTTTSWAVPDFPYNTTGAGDGSTNDSVSVARFVVYVDTLASYATSGSVNPSIAYTIQGAHGSDNSVFTIATGTLNGKDGAEMYSIPVYLQNLIAGEYPNDFSGLPSRIRVRLAFTVGSGTDTINACKLAVQYFKTDDK